MKLLIRKKTTPEPVKPAPIQVAAVVPPDLSLVGVTPRECTACGHVYVKPCDGEPSCPNFIYMQGKSKKSLKKQ